MSRKTGCGKWCWSSWQFNRRWPQRLVYGRADTGAGEFGDHKARPAGRGDAGKIVAEHATERSRRVGKGGRSRKPICGGDVASHHGRDAAMPSAQNSQQQSRSCGDLGNPLTCAAANFRRELKDARVEHRVRKPGAEHCAGQWGQWGDDIGEGQRGESCGRRQMGPPAAANVLAGRAMETGPLAKRSAMMPEPMTTLSSNAVPRVSVDGFRDMSAMVRATNGWRRRGVCRSGRQMRPMRQFGWRRTLNMPFSRSQAGSVAVVYKITHFKAC